MRNIAMLLILLLLIPSLAFADQLKDYEPYQPDEFPIWSYEIRRAETLFFGSMVITLPVAAVLYQVAQNTNIISAPSDDLQGFLVQAGIAASFSLGISVADYIIGQFGDN